MLGDPGMLTLCQDADGGGKGHLTGFSGPNVLPIMMLMSSVFALFYHGRCNNKLEIK